MVTSGQRRREARTRADQLRDEATEAVNNNDMQAMVSAVLAVESRLEELIAILTGSPSGPLRDRS